MVEEGCNPQVCTVAAKIGVFHTVAERTAFVLDLVMPLAVVHTGFERTVFVLVEVIEVVELARIGFGRNVFAMAEAM